MTKKNPELPIEQHPRNLDLALATMLYPEGAVADELDLDAKPHRSLFSMLVVALSESEPTLGETDPEGLLGAYKELADSPSRAEIVLQMRRAAVRGSNAGGVLLFIWAMRKLGVRDVGVKKVYEILSEYLASEGSLLRIVTPAAHSSSTIRDDHRAFRSVAHLWAALNLLAQSQDEPIARGLRAALEADPFRFMALAEYFRNYAESHRTSPRKKAPLLLEPGLGFSVPADLELPAIEPPTPEGAWVDWLKVWLQEKGFLPD